MATKKKRGFMDRILLGKEKSEGYARSTLPSNRWELFWDIFKGRFWKLVIINILVLLFFVPLFILIFFRSNFIYNMGAMYPFSQVFGTGYQAPTSLVGYSQNIILNADIYMYLLLPITLIFASIGVSGGAYVVRNMVWTEGIFIANDFWHGIKINFKQIVCAALIYSLFFYMIILSLDICERAIAIGADQEWLFVISKIISYVLLSFLTMMLIHSVTLSVTYKLKMRHLIKNSFLITLALAPQNIFFLFLGSIPFLLVMIGGIVMVIGIVLVLLMGFSLLLLIWTDYSQWIYDRFINDKVEGSQKNRGIYEKIKESNSKALQQYREQVARTAISSLNSKPIKPITDDELQVAELQEGFSRKDIYKLNESKEIIKADHEKYVEEHINDPEFVAIREEQKSNASEREKRIEEAKKELAKRNKKNNSK